MMAILSRKGEPIHSANLRSGHPPLEDAWHRCTHPLVGAFRRDVSITQRIHRIEFSDMYQKKDEEEEEGEGFSPPRWLRRAPEETAEGEEHGRLSTERLEAEVVRLQGALEAMRLENEDLKDEVARLQQENRRLLQHSGTSPVLPSSLAAARGMLLPVNTAAQCKKKLYTACARGTVEDLKAVISELGSPIRVAEALATSCDENERKEGALHLVASRGNVMMLEALLQPCMKKARRAIEPVINATDNMGWTPLHCAAANGHIAVCRSLLEFNADASRITVSQSSALHYLILHGSPEVPFAQYKRIVKLMIDNGADVNAQNSNAETPLHLAALSSNLNAAQALLNYKAKIALKSVKGGETCLHYAARSGSEPIVQLLLEAGADKDIAGEFGTAADVARHNRHYSLVHLLQNDGLGLQQLPDDVLLYIFKFLKTQELGSIYLTCTRFHSLLQLDVRIPGQDMTLKVAVVGGMESGTTSLLTRYVNNAFDEYPSLLHSGQLFQVKRQVGDKRVRVYFTDSSEGKQNRFQTITSSYYRGTQGALVVLDLTDPHGLEIVRKNLGELDRYVMESCPRMIVGNKADLINERVISREDAVAMADDLGIPYLEVSARTGENVKAAFNKIIDDTLLSLQENKRVLAANTAIVLQATDKKKRKGFGLFTKN